MSQQVIETSAAPAAIGPYSQAVKTGPLLFVSGQIGLQPQTGQVVSGGVEAEAHQVMQNIGAILKAAGLDYKHVVKTTIFLKSMQDFAVVNTIYASYLAAPFPARETVEVARLPKDVLVEISVIAAG
ncbi:MAG: RidA family protein [Chitinophagales bacterium]